MTAPTVQIFTFDYGDKRIDDCARDELLYIVRYLGAENERLDDALMKGYAHRAALYKRLHPWAEID